MNEGGSYMSEAKSWNNTPPRAADGRQDTAAVLAPGHGSARLPVKGWLTGYQGNQQRGMALTSSLVNSHGGDVLIQRLEQTPAGAGVKYVGSSVK